MIRLSSVPILALSGILLGACGLTDPDPRVAYVAHVDVPASLSATIGGAVTIHYGLSGCDELVGPEVRRTAASMRVTVKKRTPRGAMCPTQIVMHELELAISGPVSSPFQLVVARMQGDTTYVIPVE
jgi:hypothetical protein